MLYLAGITITFFLAILLITKKNSSSADRVLAAWLCVMGFHLLLFYWYLDKSSGYYVYMLGVSVPMPLLHGPFLYIYTLLVTRGNKFQAKYLLHFLPALIAYLFLVRFFRLSPAERISVYANKGAGFETESVVILIASIASGFTYVMLSFIELIKYKKTISEEFSNTEKINLNWLRYLIYSILVIWLIILFDGGDQLIFGAVVLFVLFMGYFGIRNIGIFSYRRELEKQVPEILKEELPRPKYEKSLLSSQQAEKIYQDLLDLVNHQKVYKNEELSLGQLAKQMAIHPNHLSQVINTYENRSFYDFINSLRIAEFKRLAQTPVNNKYTLLSLAFECGFNSKTSFNRNFKKYTGLSPSAWLKQSLVNLSPE